MEFLGHSLVKIDSKGRVTVPARFRKKIDGKTLILSKVNVTGKNVIAVFPTYECARDVLSGYFDFSEQNFDRDLSLLMGEYTVDSANRINIGKLLDGREEKEMVAVGRCVNFELWYRSDLEDYCREENLQLHL